MLFLLTPSVPSPLPLPTHQAPITSINTVRYRFSSSSAPTSVKLHALLNSVTFLCGAGGVYAIWQNKDNNGWPHLVSWHSWVGVAACGLMVLVGSGGVVEANLERRVGEVPAGRGDVVVNDNDRSIEFIIVFF